MIVLPEWSSLGIFIAAALVFLLTPGPADRGSEPRHLSIDAYPVSAGCTALSATALPVWRLCEARGFGCYRPRADLT